MLLGPHHLTESALRRFRDRVKRGAIDECWPWTGTIASNGYGFLSIFGRGGNNIGAHRIAWVLANQQSIPHSFHVCHTCDNPPCCNPSHLFLGTSRDNINDANRKGHKTGRPHFGQSNGLAKMTADKVREIRAREASGVTQRELAQRFGISQPTVWNICRRNTWRHVV